MDYATKMLEESPLVYLLMVATNHKNVFMDGHEKDARIAYKSPLTGALSSLVSYNMCVHDAMGVQMYRILKAVADGGSLLEVVCHKFEVMQGKHQVIMEWKFDSIDLGECDDVYVCGSMTDYSGAGSRDYGVAKAFFDALKLLAFPDAKYTEIAHSAADYTVFEKNVRGIEEALAEEVF